MHSFDEPTLTSEIHHLPLALRVVFAAACAERQMPAYRRFVELRGGASPSPLDLALQAIWTDPFEANDVDGLEKQIEALMQSVPREDTDAGPWTQDVSNAHNAGMAALYALRTKLRGDAREAAWAARVAYEAVDNFVINTEAIDTNTQGAELRVLAHPLVQAELDRQLVDLLDLKAHGTEPVPTLAARVRDRAVVDSTRFFRL